MLPSQRDRKMYWEVVIVTLSAPSYSYQIDQFHQEQISPLPRATKWNKLSLVIPFPVDGEAQLGGDLKTLRSEAVKL